MGQLNQKFRKKEEPIGGCLNNPVYESGAGSEGKYAPKKCMEGSQ